MKRAMFVFIAVLGVLFFGSQSLVHADANNFVFTSFEADYYISRDVEQRSTLRVQENLVAQFPDYDQNHGIERAIPGVYDGHSTSLTVTGVYKEDGSPWNYTTYDSGEYTVVRIGDANTYVQGMQTYVIDYTMRDVTKTLETGDEFFWDTNGTEWQQPFSSVVARVHVDKTLAPNLDGRVACYSGVLESDAQDCIVTTKESENETVVTTVASRPLSAGENVSVVVGFAPNTFTAYVGYELPGWAVVLIVIGVLVFYILLPVWLLVWGVRTWRQYGRDRATQWTVIPQYLPPKDNSVVQSDVVIHTALQSKAISATIIDLAVRHYIKIYEVGKKEFELELVKSPETLQADDKRVIGMFFGSTQSIGDRVALKDLKDMYSELVKFSKDAYATAIDDGYMADTRGLQKKMLGAGVGLLVLGMFTLNVLICIAAIIVLIASYYMPARTKKGVELKGYLDGTKMYMEVAESERMKLLQGPETVATVNTGDKEQLVKLYERLLPFAMLYGIEKDWAKQFSHLYTQDTQPDWYVGNNAAFNAVVFASAMSSFGSVAQSSFAPPSNSGGSGFSGGSSGGGGGGGGGGGW